MEQVPYLMEEFLIRGLAEALAEVSVVAGAEVAADSDFGGKFKLASNVYGINYRKEGFHAKR
jgi:hypothetical protein